MESLLLCKLERFTGWRLSYFPGIVKLWESPGRAGGLPKRNYPLVRIRVFLVFFENGSSPWPRLPPVDLEVLEQQFPGTPPLPAADDALPFHDLHQSGGPVVADAQFALDHGDGDLPGLPDDLQGCTVSDRSSKKRC